MLSSYSVALQTTSGQGTLQLVVPATAPTITLSHDQPITGSVVVSISGGGTYSSANYYVDLNGFASSTTAPTYPVTLDTRTLTAGAPLRRRPRAPNRGPSCLAPPPARVP